MLTVVTGPPCVGKSTYVRERARAGEVVIDFDTLAQALGSPVTHGHPEHVRQVAIATRRAAIKAVVGQHYAGAHVWIIHTSISRDDLDTYRSMGADIVTLTETPEVLHARAAAGRPEMWHRLIDDWRPTTLTGRATVSDRNLEDNPLYRRGRRGRPYLRWRAAVLARSTVCWICGHEGADSPDHIEPLADIVARGGDPLDVDNGAPAHHSLVPHVDVDATVRAVGRLAVVLHAVMRMAMGSRQ